MSNPFEAPWTSVAPSSWQRTYLGHLVDVRSGATPSKDEPSFWNGEIPWVSPKDMKVLRIADSEDHVSDAALSGSALRWVAKGSVLMVTRGMILNHTVPIALAERPLTINQDMKALVPRRDLQGDYLMWLLVGLNPAILARVEEAAHGTKALRTEQWRKLPLAVPPIDIQRRIADFLDRKTASIDTLIAKREQLLALLAEKRQALITQAVTKGLDPNVPMKDTGVAWFGQVPKHWEVSRIGYMAVVGNGSTPSREEARFWSEDENGYPWLNSARINDERIVRAERWVTCDALRECHLPKVPPGSVVVAITGEGQTRARAALLEIEATISQHLAYVRPRHGLNAVFLWRQLQAAYQWLRDQSAGGGSTRAALTCEFLRTVSIVVPPLAEQELIVSHIDSELRRIDSLSQRVQAMIERLREYRQTLITAAVTGQLDVTPTIHSERRPSPQAEAV